MGRRKPPYRIEITYEANAHLAGLSAGEKRVVTIQAVGVKARDRVLIGGEEVELK